MVTSLAVGAPPIELLTTPVDGLVEETTTFVGEVEKEKELVVPLEVDKEEEEEGHVEALMDLPEVKNDEGVLQEDVKNVTVKENNSSKKEGTEEVAVEVDKLMNVTATTATLDTRTTSDMTVKEEETTMEISTTETSTPTTTTVSTTTIATLPPPPELSAKERKALLGHLGNLDLDNVEKLVLTPRQKLAIQQELEYQRRGLAPFTDPTPWQSLSTEHQGEFNRKFNELSPALQQYSKEQFASLPADRQKHAFQMFLNLSIEELSEVLQQELIRQVEVLQQQRELLERQQQERRKQEQKERLKAQQKIRELENLQHLRHEAGQGRQRLRPVQTRQKQQEQEETRFAPSSSSQPDHFQHQQEKDTTSAPRFAPGQGRRRLTSRRRLGQNRQSVDRQPKVKVSQDLSLS